MSLFCMLHFCILGQTEKMATSFLAVEMERIMCEKIYSMMVLRPRQGSLRLVFRLLKSHARQSLA